MKKESHSRFPPAIEKMKPADPGKFEKALAPAERMIVELLRRGKTEAEIAAKQGIKIGSVRSAYHQIATKAKVDTEELRQYVNGELISTENS